MPIRINNIHLDLDGDFGDIKKKVSQKLNISESQIKNIKILRETIDARKKNNIILNYSVEAFTDSDENAVKKANSRDVLYYKEEQKPAIKYGDKKLTHRPVIVGMGPAGMFAGLLLAENGYKPIIVERGDSIDKRWDKVKKFWNGGALDEESNVQFGEGGAGTFSDGKLTTRIKDRRCDFVLDEFVKMGAPKEIKYIGKPHIGTDILRKVVKNIREKITSLGGEIYFNTRLNGLITDGRVLKGIKAVRNGNENCEIPCEALILAVGHSSRDTFDMLNASGILMKPKAFAVGVRVEHLQEIINKNQYGRFAGHKKLGAADYRLTYTSEKFNRACYSFCMCPGGEVVAAASERGGVVTNGMSYYKRDKKNANSAIVVTVNPDDFKFSGPLSGVRFQQSLEKLAFKYGGGNYFAPVQLVSDFIRDVKSTKIGNVEPSYKPGFEFTNFNDIFSDSIAGTLKEGFLNFDRKIKGFSECGAVMTGVETRTSSPVRIERNEKLESISLSGLYPAGEGAGFAGGIVSSAVDGIKAAESIMGTWKL